MPYSGLHLVTYLDVGNFCDKSTKTTLHEIYAQVFLRFSDSSKPSQSVLLIYKMTWLAGIRKSDENLLKSCKVAPVTKVQITNVYFGDVTTIENNRQVRVNIDATLVAMSPSILEISAHGYPMTQLSPLGPLVFRQS